MKHLGIKFTSLFFAFALIVLSAAPAFADDSAETKKSSGSVLTINQSGKVEAGKTVTYTMYLSDAEPVEGFQLEIFYDKDHLKYKKGSLSFEKFDSVFFNEGVEGRLLMNYTSITNLPSFEDKAKFVSADFEVLKDGDTTISYFFTELYGKDMQDFKRYTLTYDLTVDGNNVLSDGVPVVNDDPEVISKYEGDFVNYADGMGDDNSPKNKEHVRVGSGVKTNVVDVNKNNSGDEKGGSGNGILKIVIIAAFALLIAGAIVFAVISVRKNNKSDEQLTQ